MVIFLIQGKLSSGATSFTHEHLTQGRAAPNNFPDVEMGGYHLLDGHLMASTG